MKNIIFRKKKLWPIGIFVILFVFAVFNLLFKVEFSYRWKNLDSDQVENFFPKGGSILPVKWGDLGQKLVEKGVIDKEQFENLYEQRGGLSDYEKNLLEGSSNDKVKITKENAGFILNLFWAFGLANKNPILTDGPMQDEEYGGAGGFASTGGWILAKGNIMDHYSKYDLVTLTEAQQALVEKVSKNIYRPCCDNSTYFPDCNHGMAMLGFLELIASQGADEDEMYEAALTLNSYWFPNNYLTIAEYFKTVDKSWDDIDPKEILSINYSSSSGFSQVLTKVNPVESKGGPGCGV